MTKRLREYHRPTNLAAALELLRRPHTAPLMLGPRVPLNLYEGLEAVIDLSQLSLDRVTESGATVQIGPLVTLQTVADSEILSRHHLGLIAAAARQAVASGLRQATTIGGALLAHNGPSEVLLALLACRADVIVQGDKQRQIDLDDFLAAENRLTPGELIVQVILTPGDDGGGGALERIARAPREDAILVAAASMRVEDGRCRFPGFALAGVGPRPYRVKSVERVLDHQAVTPELLSQVTQIVEADVTPVSDFRASADYRRAMVGILARRALETAWRRAVENH